jgi:hypothetical protein
MLCGTHRVDPLEVAGEAWRVVNNTLKAHLLRKTTFRVEDRLQNNIEGSSKRVLDGGQHFQFYYWAGAR